MVLADHLAALKVDPGKRFLEIGCGLGLVGIVAAFCGHQITMTEFNEHALNFASANAHANLDFPNQCIEILRLDWKDPRLEGTFHRILGSEVVYKETDFDALIKLFQTCMDPDGEIVLAERLRESTIEFFRRATPFFHITAQKKVLRAQSLQFRVILATMTRKRQTRPQATV